LPSYAFNPSGSPPVDHRSRLGGPCNIPINRLTSYECFPERLPCLVKYLKATQLFPRPYPGTTSHVYNIYETIPPLDTTWYTIWAKVIVIVAAYRRVVTPAPPPPVRDPASPKESQTWPLRPRSGPTSSCLLPWLSSSAPPPLVSLLGCPCLHPLSTTPLQIPFFSLPPYPPLVLETSQSDLYFP